MDTLPCCPSLLLKRVRKLSLRDAAQLTFNIYMSCLVWTDLKWNISSSVGAFFQYRRFKISTDLHLSKLQSTRIVLCPTNHKNNPSWDQGHTCVYNAGSLVKKGWQKASNYRLDRINNIVKYCLIPLRSSVGLWSRANFQNNICSRHLWFKLINAFKLA